MIHITGDFTRFAEEEFSIQTEISRNDYLIICGNFRGVWTFEKEALDWLNNKSFTTLFIDENHENYTRLYNYPVEEWNDGKVHKIRDSILHLMRGEMFDIDNKKIFTFGRAKSHDIQDGILNLDEEEKIEELVNMVEDYKIVCEIRNYVNAISKQDNLTSEIKEWIKWANKKASWFDPIIDEEDELLGKREYKQSRENKNNKLDKYGSYY